MGDAQLKEGGAMVVAALEEKGVQDAAAAFLSVHAAAYEVQHSTRQLHLRRKNSPQS